jgi:hypothetical protein
MLVTGCDTSDWPQLCQPCRKVMCSDCMSRCDGTTVRSDSVDPGERASMDFGKWHDGFDQFHTLDKSFLLLCALSV